MNRMLKELPGHNLFYLLSERELTPSINVVAVELENELHAEKDSNTNTKIPCKSSKAATVWRKQRDQLLLEYLQLFLAESSESKCLLLVSSVSEVNTTLAVLRQALPSVAEAFTGIGRSPESISKLQSSFECAELIAARVLVLSAPIALLGLVHGFVQLKAFSAIIFADARGANQAHPFCQLMNHFYTSVSLKARILGFAALPDPEKVFNPQDVFSRRDWLRQLRHYNRTFQSAVQVFDFDADNGLLKEFLDDFGKCTECFEPLSILQSCITDDVDGADVDGAAFIEDLDAEITSMANVLVIKNQSRVPQLINFLERAFAAGIERVIHFHNNAQVAGRLSLAAFLRRLRCPEQTDLTLLQKVAHDAEAILSPQIHWHDCLKMDTESTQAWQQLTPPAKAIPLQNFSFDHEAAFRLPSTGALASLESAVGILVRACTLIAEPFRSHPEHREVIKLENFRAFPEKDGRKLSTSPGFVALLKLPRLMQEAIHAHLLTSEAASFDTQFEGWFQGSLQLTRLEAQGITALRAIKLLHAAGVLNDHLMLAGQYCQSNETISIEGSVEETVEATLAGGDDEDEYVGTESKVACFDEIIPDALLKSALEDRLYIYALEYELKADDEADPFTLTPNSRILHFSSSLDAGLNMFSSRNSCLTWSILLPSRLPDEFLPVEVPLGSDHLFKTRLRLIGELPVSSPQYRQLLHLQPILFNLFNMRPLTAPKFGEETDESAGMAELKIPEKKCPFYLIAPLKNVKLPGGSHLLSPSELPQLHNVFEAFVQSFQAAPLEGAQVSIASGKTTSPQWSIDWSLCESLAMTDVNIQEANLSAYLTALTTFPSELKVQLEEGAHALDFKDFALSRLLIHTPHTHTIYRPARLRPEFTPDSPFTSASLPEAGTYAQYAQLRYHLPAPKDPAQALLQVKRIENWADLAVWGSLDAASKHRSRAKKRTPDQLPSLLIPEHANVLPLPYAAVRMAMLLPRVSAEVERQLRISQFFSSSPLLASLPVKPRHRSSVQALTASSAALSYSYEQLEVLGDSLLKHLSSLDVLAGFGAQGWGEGKLTALRMEKLCNARLCEAGEAVGVFDFATFTPFLARLWTASPQLNDLLSVSVDHMDSASGTNSDVDNYYRALNRRRIGTLFDKEDRWIALNALQGKHSQRTQALLLSLHSNLLTTDPTGHQTRAEKRGRGVVLYRHGQAVPPKKIADVMEALIGAYYTDCGVSGALAFLNAAGVLRGDLVQAALCKDALRSEFLTLNRNTLPEASVVEKWKRRKPTPLNSLLIERISELRTANDPASPSAQSQALPIAIQSIDNVHPNLPPPSDFPYSQLEGLLNYSFTNRQLLFQAFTHTSGVDGVVVEGDNEVLEWIGDAALDWVVCRYYWYGLRDHEEEEDEESDSKGEVDIVDGCDSDRVMTDIVATGTTAGNDTTIATTMPTTIATTIATTMPTTITTIPTTSTSASSDLSFYKCLIEAFDTSVPEFIRPHPAEGRLPLSPDDLTRARQSITNNDALARIAVHFGLHRNLRIDSAHLQREIEKFSRELASDGGESIGVEVIPESLASLDNPLSMTAPKALSDLFEALAGAVLIDVGCSDDAFCRVMAPFLDWYLFTHPTAQSSFRLNPIEQLLHLYAKLGIPRHQITCTFEQIGGLERVIGFACKIWVRERCVGEAEAASRRLAKRMAMERALERLQQGGWKEHL